MSFTRRDALLAGSAAIATAAIGLKTEARISSGPDIAAGDRVLICNEDSNTLSVIDPATNKVSETINLTSFDADPRPPFRFVTGGITPTHAAMVTKPLYHGAINIHGAAPSPDQSMAAVTGRGSSNIYLIDMITRSVIGNRANPLARETTVSQALTSGVMVGREPHEPTWSRNGREIWVALRGEDRIAILDTELAKAESAGKNVRAIRSYLPAIHGPAQVWFSRDGAQAFICSQKVSQIVVYDTNVGANGFSQPKYRTTLNISGQDPFGFTPFQKLTPDGREMWFAHKLADGVSARSVDGEHALLDHVSLGALSRPNHVEFVENAKGRVVYVSFARVDDNAGGTASSRIAIIDRSAGPGQRKVVGQFFSQGREAHGMWTNPTHNLLYVSHEQDELPGTPNEGQTVCSVFDVSEPLAPKFITQIPLGHLELPSGKLRNKKSINLVYFRPHSPMHSG
ncbi:YncE family protein [Ferrovibrio terrae]|uniref:YncE family protein n=1 Tax=Ferrovibrio terrae TaxID=2594003 RepID=A0A516GYL5_9PROT|nr:YncE family protein [Ferrovibrio terrae]QDO96621.1 YncE family protein [Ferrovibrio terrae]